MWVTDSETVWLKDPVGVWVTDTDALWLNDDVDEDVPDTEGHFDTSIDPVEDIRFDADTECVEDTESLTEYVSNVVGEKALLADLDINGVFDTYIDADSDDEPFDERENDCSAVEEEDLAGDGEPEGLVDTDLDVRALGDNDFVNEPLWVFELEGDKLA